LATTQARFTQTDAEARDGYVLHDFVLALAQWARHRLGVRLDYGGAHDRQRAVRGATRLQLEQALARLRQLTQGALGLTPLSSRSRLFGHVSEPSE
jgi:hypothetical protein